jgi:hypothetical protein
MTRWTEQAENLPDDYEQAMWRRVSIANYGNDGAGYGVTEFISIHHNGYIGIQGSEVWWSSQLRTITDTLRSHGYWRVAYQDSLLAMKTEFRLLDLWNYKDRCITRCSAGGGNFCCDETRLSSVERKFVLYNTIMPSGLSEASNLKDTTEELLFDNPGTGHADSEAIALYDGWYSHADNKGIAIVRNSTTLGNNGKVIIADWPCDNGDTVSSPYLRCWLMSEQHCLVAITPQNIYGHEYTFHHWTHLNPMGVPIGDNWYDPVWFITVPAENDYHLYVAYFTGGPYSAHVNTPNGGQNWHPGEQRFVEWNVSPGADSTTLVSVYLDRNGGNDGYPELIIDNKLGAYYSGWQWTVTDTFSSNCKVKVVATDVAGNSASDVTDSYFFISASGNNNPVIDSPIHCKYPQEECNQCFHLGESRTLEIHAHDPDGDSMFYEWTCYPPPLGGHFPNDSNHIITPQNYVIYTAPAQIKEESDTLVRDHLSVGVSDIRGGQTPNYAEGDVVLKTPGHSCICGDLSGEGVIDAGDVVALIGYLFRGKPLSWLEEQGDVTNDSIIDAADVIYLLAYLYRSGSHPVCCWIH